MGLATLGFAVGFLWGRGRTGEGMWWRLDASRKLLETTWSCLVGVSKCHCIGGSLRKMKVYSQ